jgi:hypothetical protein
MSKKKFLNASLFVRNRHNALSITSSRINHIFWYLAECYTFLVKDNVIYSKKWIKANTTITVEDYLKMEFVDKYLIPNKELLSARLPALEQVNFAYETQKRYVDSGDNKEKPDKIDILINKLGLHSVWREHDEFVYLAVECKRIKTLSNARDYVGDIFKFCARQYVNLRLPIEGMIGFIENKNVSHISASNKINENLNKQDNITTLQTLSASSKHPTFDGIYDSIHCKHNDPSKHFTVTHLFFDYSNVLNY